MTSISKWEFLRIRQGEKYPHLARVRELESVKSKLKSTQRYIDECKKRPKRLKIHMAHIKEAPEDWNKEEFDE